MCAKSSREGLTQQDRRVIIDLQMKLLKEFDRAGGPDAFIENFNANPDDYKQYHDDIRILKALIEEKPDLIDRIDRDIKKFINHRDVEIFLGHIENPPNPLSDLETAPPASPPNPSYSEMDEHLRNSFRMALQDDLNRDIILSKMSLPALTKLHEDFSQDFQKTKNVKSQVIYQTLLTKVQQNIEKKALNQIENPSNPLSDLEMAPPASPPNPSYSEMALPAKKSFRLAFVQAGRKREAILSKMTLPELEELRGDFNEALQNARDDKFKQIYQQLIVQIDKTINPVTEKQPTRESKQPAPESKKSSFKLFSKKHDKEHGAKQSLGEKMKDTMSKIIPGRRKG